jgi:hypothetical protein
MTVDLIVYGDVALRKVAFAPQGCNSVLYCAEVPAGSILQGDALITRNRRSLTAYDVYMAAKIGANGFRIVPPTLRQNGNKREF